MAVVPASAQLSSWQRRILSSVSSTLSKGKRAGEAPNALVRAYEDWDGTSAQLVEAATIAFGFLLLPQASRASHSTR